MMCHLSRVLLLIMGVLALNMSCLGRSDSDNPLTPEQAAVQGVCYFGSDPIDVSTLDKRVTTGKLTVYTFIPPSQHETYLKDFNLRCPNIKINIHYEPPGPLTERLLREKHAPQADVIWGVAATNLILMDWYDLLSPYSPANIERIKPEFRDSNKPPYWVGIDAWMIGLCVNPELLEKQGLPFPIAWSDLTNPVYQDQIVLYNPYLTGTGFMMISHILQRHGEVDGWAYLDALHRNIASYTQADEEACALVADGKKPIGISYALAGIELKAQGKPIEPVFPVGLSGWDMEANALIKKDQIKPAAKTFLDWTLSKTAMHAYAKNYAIISRRDIDVPIPKGYPKEPAKQLFDRDFLWDAANRQRILDTLKARYGDKASGAPLSGDS